MWSTGVVDLVAFGNHSNVTIRFRGTTGNSYESDMAVDAVSILNNAMHTYGSGDIDLDNVLDAWEEYYFGAVLNWEPSDNYDGDMHNNLQEYISDTNPLDANSYFTFTVTPAPALSSECYVDWRSVSGRIYDIVWTSSLTNSFENMVTNIVYPQNSYTDTVHGTESQGFYKVEVRLEQE